MTDTAIAYEGVSKTYPGVNALDDVSFEVRAGDLHCLLGENGAGKSTLIKILGGAQRRDAGSIRVFGQEVDFGSPSEAHAKGIGVVYQELSNFSDLEVAHNIFPNHLPSKGGVIDYPELYRAARERLNACGLGLVSEKATMGDISLGQQQMVEIARLVGEDVRIVILDEPTSALAEAEVKILFRLIELMKAAGITIIYISHRLDEVLALADRITVLKDGRHVRTFERTPETTKDELVRYMVGRDVAFHFRDGTDDRGEPILEVQGLSSDDFVQDISFTLHHGEVLGIAGLEGSGRTELLEALFGLRPITAGRVRKDGVDVRIRHPMHAKRLGLAYITKDRKRMGLFPGLDVMRNIIAASQEKGVRHGLIHEKTIATRAQGYVDALRIKCSGLKQPALNLSGGNQQKVLLSMWLSTDPEIIMIDEPTRGIDVSAKAEIHQLLHRYAAQGNAIVFVSSELTEILASCDRVLVMYEGRMTGVLDNDGLTEEQIMHLASGA